MNIVDSSGWLEYFADASNADFFAESIENVEELIVPTISLYEVFKRVLQQKGENEALEAVALMMQGHITSLDSSTAIDAARLSDESKLPMADSIMLASANRHDAILWTQDADFSELPGVKYVEKR
jgi:predicted nucleic acid-binding protein